MVDFAVAEVLLLRVLNEDQEAREQAERKAWKEDKSELREFAN